MRKIDFLNYSVKDFLLDESFQRWVSQDDVVSTDQFDKWLKEYPEKRDTLEQARTILLQMQSHLEADTSQNEIEEIWSRIQNTIDNTLINQD
jgi:hypothetical protein